MKLSVVVPTFNKLPRLKLMITSALNQNFNKNDYEVCIVDDGSYDGTEDYMKAILKEESNVKYIRQSNKGRSAARNLGIFNTSGELIIFTDDDIIMEPNFINRHLKVNKYNKVLHGRIINLTALKFYEDPTNGIFFNGLKRTYENKGILDLLCIKEDDILCKFDEKIANNKKISSSEWLIEKVFENNLSDYYWLGFTGGNVSVPRSFIMSVGGFDENFGTEWGYEDFELGYRLLKRNFQFSYDFEAKGYHIAHFRKSLKIESDLTGSYFKKKQNDDKITLITEFVAGNIQKEKVLNKMLNF